MPFTLAHPAAILPLKRYCPRYLDFGALVVGSVCPDIGYCLTRFRMDEISHSFKGSFTFDLPVGAFMLAALYLARRPFVNLLPERLRAAFLPLCQRPIGSPLILLVSLLLGIWSHLAWDSFTHVHGWFVRHYPVMQTSLVTAGQRSLRLSHVSWYVCSFGGVACLCVAYERWRHTAQPDAPPFSWSVALRRALCLGALIVPVEVLHHVINGPVGFITVGVCSLALLAGVVLFIEHDLSARPRPSA